MRPLFAQKIGEELAWRQLAPSCFGNLLKGLADRRADLEVPVAMDGPEEAVGNMLGKGVDDLADRAGIPAEIVAHQAAFLRATWLTRPSRTPKSSTRAGASATLLNVILCRSSSRWSAMLVAIDRRYATSTGGVSRIC